MQLSAEDQNKFKEWLQKKTGASIFRCTCCGLGHWDIAPCASILLGFNTHTTRFFYHQGIPVFSVTCTNCGHMLLFSAAIVGFAPDPVPVVAVEDAPISEAPAISPSPA